MFNDISIFSTDLLAFVVLCKLNWYIFHKAFLDSLGKNFASSSELPEHFAFALWGYFLPGIVASRGNVLLPLIDGRLRSLPLFLGLSTMYHIKRGLRVVAITGALVYFRRY